MSTINEQRAEAKAQELLTVEQVSLLTQLHEQTIYRKIRKGEIPGVVRFGRTVRFVKVVVLGWNLRLQKHAVQ